MTYTQEQIDSMSRFEVNKAVAEKLDYTGISSMTEQESYNQCGRDSVLLGRSKEFRPTDDPKDYMPIAIKHGIDLTFLRRFVCASAASSEFNQYSRTKPYPRTDTGLAVCAAFLMMEVGG